MPATVTKPLIVIPAYNEEQAIGDVLAAIHDVDPMLPVLVVDDASEDATAAAAASRGALVATHAYNLGVGGAMRTGFQYAFRHGFDAVVQVDGDGQHDPAQIKLLLEALEHDDVVVGSRFAEGRSYPVGRLRRLAIRLLSRVVSIHCRTRLTDASSGFRATGPGAIELFAAHYPVEYLGDTAESLVLAGKVGLSVTEVPVTMQQRRQGQPSQSTFNAVMHLVRALFVALQSFIRRPPRGSANLVRSR